MKTSEKYQELLWKKYQEVNNPDRFKRYQHSLAVKEKALEIIKTFNLDVDSEKATIAALLHDYAKFENYDRYLEIIEKYQLDSKFLSINPKLLHAFLGPYIIQEELGIRDKEILEAIKTHTTGSLEMSKLAEVIFLADYTEENRQGHYFEEAKRLSKIDFYAAILEKIKRLLESYQNEETKKLYQKYLEAQCKKF